MELATLVDCHRTPLGQRALEARPLQQALDVAQHLGLQHRCLVALLRQFRLNVETDRCHDLQVPVHQLMHQSCWLGVGVEQDLLDGVSAFDLGLAEHALLIAFLAKEDVRISTEVALVLGGLDLVRVESDDVATVDHAVKATGTQNTLLCRAIVFKSRRTNRLTLE